MRMTYVLMMGVALAGCATISEVVPAGKDSYMVTSNSRASAMGGDSVRALQAANKYCATMSKVVQIRNTDTSSSYNFAQASLIFSCLDASDPEYQRPNLRKEPTTLIEDARR